MEKEEIIEEERKEMIKNPIAWASKERDKYWIRKIKMEKRLTLIEQIEILREYNPKRTIAEMINLLDGMLKYDDCSGVFDIILINGVNINKKMTKEKPSKELRKACEDIGKAIGTHEMVMEAKKEKPAYIECPKCKINYSICNCSGLHKEKPLSEKAVMIYVEMGKSDVLFDGTKCAGMMIHEDYIKEAVEKLKDIYCHCKPRKKWDCTFCQNLDKIFGEFK